MEYRQLLAVFLYLSLSNSDDIVITKPYILSLNGDSWNVKGIKNSTTIKGTVPGGIYTDLRRAGKLEEDILFGDNDIKYRWVAKDEWTYSTTFKVEKEVMSRENVWLVFHGLDTVALINLNNKTLAEVNNMFIRYRFDVKKLLKDGDNELEVKFTSPIDAAKNSSSKSKYSIPQDCPPEEYHGECHVNFLRKMQASFSWDWGPAFPSVGIWKPVSIEAFDKVIIRSVSVTTDKLMDTWEVLTTVHLDTAPNTVHSIHADLNIFSTSSDGNIQQVKFDLEPIDIQVKSNEEGEASFTIDEIFINENYVNTWWPNGYGSQPLYTLEVKLKTDNKEETNETVQFGFRTVKLVQDFVNCQEQSKGRLFQFEVNGIKIFSKGGNYVPAHILPELGSDTEQIKTMLYSIKEAHMNMIRVWGGGVYESDDFYRLCDEMGIMVWQDMMFSCNMYPADDEFLKSVTKEITQNVRRLQKHPSIVVWAGNNENEVALVQSWYRTSANYDQYKEDYVKLYGKIIRGAIEESDKSRPYVTSSPSNGLKTEEEGSVSLTPTSMLYGDYHDFSYYANNWKSSYTQPARFVSEYGIQSLPSYSTLLQATTTENLSNITSIFFQNRQHHSSGYQQMAAEITMNLPSPEDNLRSYIYYSQINQAMSIKTKTELFRRYRDSQRDDGVGRTMGALYWQLNDVWQAPSWSSIEYGGKWKMLHHYAKDFFAPILISPWLTNKQKVAVAIISDKRSGPPLKLMLETLVYRWDSNNPVATVISSPFRLNPLTTVTMPEVSLTEALSSSECGSEDEAPRKCFLVFNLKDKKNTSHIAPQAFLFPESINRIEPKESSIKVVSVKKVDVQHKSQFLPKETEKYDVTLTTDAISLFVWLDVGHIEGHFYENGFLFIPTEKTVSFMSYKPISECEILNALNIQTIRGKFTVDESAMESCTPHDEPAKKEEPKSEEKKPETQEEKMPPVPPIVPETTVIATDKKEGDVKPEETKAETTEKAEGSLPVPEIEEPKAETEKSEIKSSAPTIDINSVIVAISLSTVVLWIFI